MESRATLRVGIEFCTVIVSWALLKSLYKIHVLWVYQ